MDMNLGKLWEMVKDREARVLQSLGLQKVGHNLVTEKQQQQQQFLIMGICCTGFTHPTQLERFTSVDV